MPKLRIHFRKTRELSLPSSLPCPLCLWGLLHQNNTHSSPIHSYYNMDLLTNTHIDSALFDMSSADFDRFDDYIRATAPPVAPVAPSYASTAPASAPEDEFDFFCSGDAMLDDSSLTQGERSALKHAEEKTGVAIVQQLDPVEAFVRCVLLLFFLPLLPSFLTNKNPLPPLSSPNQQLCAHV